MVPSSEPVIFTACWIGAPQPCWDGSTTQHGMTLSQRHLGQERISAGAEQSHVPTRPWTTNKEIKLGAATACSHSRINLCHIENFPPSERVSPCSCISTVYTKEPKGTEGQGLTFLLASLSRSHHPGVGHNAQQQTLSILCRGSGCCGSWAAPWPQARRWLANDLVGAVLLVQEGQAPHRDPEARNGTPSTLPEVQALLGLERKVFWFA